VGDGYVELAQVSSIARTAWSAACWTLGSSTSLKVAVWAPSPVDVTWVSEA